MADVGQVRQILSAAVKVASANDMPQAIEDVMQAVRPLGYTVCNVVRQKVMRGAFEADLLYSTGDAGRQARYARECAAVDPMVHRTASLGQVKTARDIGAMPLRPEEVRALDTIRELTACNDACLIPVAQGSGAGVVSFAGHKPDTSAAVRDALNVLGHVIYDRFMDLMLAPEPTPTGKALSRREREILNWVAQGKCDSEIAIILGISERTSRFHMANVKRKLRAPTRIEAVTLAVRAGLIGG
ncbi:MAG TPA: hypothetical protein DCL54_11270 [Alphaproteobacteria bacterium]|nr:hypothetical protein [Alphaproteobacteria bacterium]HAJ47146.1 hypothetical protein [Alphaproteobacteria bacterium]